MAFLTSLENDSDMIARNFFVFFNVQSVEDSKLMLIFDPFRCSWVLRSCQKSALIAIVKTVVILGYDATAIAVCCSQTPTLTLTLTLTLITFAMIDFVYSGPWL